MRKGYGAMRSAEELKQIFQEGWSIPARIDNYVRNVADAEFTTGDCCEAWRASLDEVLGGQSNLYILDMGTGPGIFACLFAGLGHRCVGLDFSDRMLAEARRRANELGIEGEFVRGDAELPPFDDAQFDVVASRHLLFNLPRPGVALREWYRVLKPAGRMILIGDEPDIENGRSSRHRARRDHRRRGQGWSPSPHYAEAVAQCPLFRNSTPDVLRSLMEAIGLDDIRCRGGDAIFAERQRRSLTLRQPLRAARPFILVGSKPIGGPRPE